MTRPIFEPEERTYWYSVWDGPARWSQSAWYHHTDGYGSCGIAWEFTFCPKCRRRVEEEK